MKSPSSRLYHTFKERLKPRLQRVVKQRFEQAPDSKEALDRDLTLLYSFLMKEVALVLNGAFSNARAASGLEPQAEVRTSPVN